MRTYTGVFLFLSFLLTSSAYSNEIVVSAGGADYRTLQLHPHGMRAVVGAGVLFEIAPHLELLPSAGFEWKPNSSTWGLTGTPVLDRRIGTYVGLDLIAGVFHHQEGSEFDHAEYFVGGGPGVSFFPGHWIIAPAVLFLQGVNHEHERLVSPGIMVGHPL